MDSIKKQILRWLGIVLGTTLVISLIILIIGVKLQWERPSQFATAFFFAGAIVATLGRYLVSAEAIQRTELEINIAETATNTPSHERIQQGVEDRKERDKSLLFINIVSILLIAISFLIYKFL